MEAKLTPVVDESSERDEREGQGDDAERGEEEAVQLWEQVSTLR